jgi:hypothetical protein
MFIPAAMFAARHGVVVTTQLLGLLVTLGSEQGSSRYEYETDPADPPFELFVSDEVRRRPPSRTKFFASWIEV